MLVTSVGCESLRKSPSVPNPVVGPPPPRFNSEEAIAADDERLREQAIAKQAAIARAQDAAGADDGSFRTASASADEGAFADFARMEIAEATATGPSLLIGPNDPIEDSTIVATVNSQPILAAAVFEPFRGRLNEVEAMEGGLTPDGQIVPEGASQEFKRLILKRRLDSHIERVILAQAGENALEAEQLEQIDEVMSDAWQEEVEKMMARSKVETRAELSEELVKQGQSLQGLEEMFRMQQKAGIWASMHKPADRPIGRQDILDYYNTHLDEFSHKARARWQQLVISIPRSGGRAAAIDRLEGVMADLKTGTAFGDVIRKHSDGDRADRGGQYDWVEPGEVEDAEIDNALFAAPVGSFSKVFEQDDAFVIVRVTERDEPGRTPVEKVQEQIRQKIVAERRKASQETMLADVMAEAVVEKFFR
ncbi:MAG: peptidylprolyl isomerase [Planctomycetota bacterium]